MEYIHTYTCINTYTYIHIYISPLALHGLGCHLRRGSRKIVKSRRNKYLQQNSLFQIWQFLYTNEILEAVTACSWPAPNRVSPNISINGGGESLNPVPSKGVAVSWQLLGERVSFLWGCGLWKVTHVPVDNPTPRHVRAALNGVSGF